MACGPNPLQQFIILVFYYVWTTSNKRQNQNRSSSLTPKMLVCVNKNKGLNFSILYFSGRSLDDFQTAVEPDVSLKYYKSHNYQDLLCSVWSASLRKNTELWAKELSVGLGRPKKLSWKQKKKTQSI